MGDMKQALHSRLLNTNTSVAVAAHELGIEEESAWIILDNLDLMDCSVCRKWRPMDTINDDECVDCSH